MRARSYNKGDHGMMHWKGAPGPGCATYRCKGSCDNPGSGAGKRFQTIWQSIEPLTQELESLKKRHKSNLPIQVKEKITNLQGKINFYLAKIEEIKNNIKNGTFAATEPKEEVKEHNYYDTKDEEHKWAKHSTVKNVGDDLEGSARHKRNANRDWQSVDDLINATQEQKKLITKRKLDELYIIDYVSVANKSKDPEMALAMKEYMDKFVAKPGYMKPEDYIADYEWMNSKVKEIIEKDLPAFAAIKELRAELRTRFYKLKEESKLDTQPEAKEQSYYRLAHLRRLNNSNVENTIYKFRHEGTSGTRFAYDPTSDPTYKVRVLSRLKEGKPKKTSTSGGVKDQGPKESDFYKNIKLEITGGKLPKSAAEAQEDLVKGYGIVGLQYGNSLSDEERASFTINSNRSLDDLSEAYGLSKSKISFGGTLGLSFGARGKPGSIAHFDPSINVLSFNRQGGTGALAHEWGHGLDHFIRNSGSDETKEKLYQLKANIRQSKFFARLLKEEDYKTLSYKKRNYWASESECLARCFESYTQMKVEQNKKKNTFLVAGIEAPFWPTRDEMSELSNSFDELLLSYKRD